MTGLIGKDMRAVVCQEGEEEVLFYTDLASGRLVKHGRACNSSCGTRPIILACVFVLLLNLFAFHSAAMRSHADQLL